MRMCYVSLLRTSQHICEEWRQPLKCSLNLAETDGLNISPVKWLHSLKNSKNSKNTCNHHWPEWAALPREHLSNYMFVIMWKCLGGTQSSALLRNRWEADLPNSESARLHVHRCSVQMCVQPTFVCACCHICFWASKVHKCSRGRGRRKKKKQKTRRADGTDVTNACCLRASEFSVSPLAQTWRAIREREGKKNRWEIWEREKWDFGMQQQPVLQRLSLEPFPGHQNMALSCPSRDRRSKPLAAPEVPQNAVHHHWLELLLSGFVLQNIFNCIFM